MAGGPPGSRARSRPGPARRRTRCTRERRRFPSAPRSAAPPASTPAKSAAIGSAASAAGMSRSQAAVDDPERALRPGQKADQVVSGDVLPHRAAGRHDLARRDHGLDPRHPRAGRPVLECVRAAGVRRHVAADLRLLGGARDPAGTRGRSRGRSGAPPRWDAGLDVDPPLERIERPHPRHPSRCRRRSRPAARRRPRTRSRRRAS